jgi:mRNA-degrading endonuclease toxin of MazEF toxin-antitoxin module
MRGPTTENQSSTVGRLQMRAIPKQNLAKRIRALSEIELAELELATDEALGRVEPEDAA